MNKKCFHVSNVLSMKGPDLNAKFITKQRFSNQKAVNAGNEAVNGRDGTMGNYSTRRWAKRPGDKGKLRQVDTGARRQGDNVYWCLVLN